MRPHTLAPWLVAAAALATSTTTHAATFHLSTATIPEINAALDAGALTSEKLTGLYLARIAAYEPSLHAIITLNPKAREEARALDAERRAGKVRSPLHGIPVVLKDNFDTTDLPTTGGFYGLKDSLPPSDATLTAQLRQAGAIILAKVNLSEFASGGAMSSLGGQSHNPHNLAVTPAGSSGGTGVAIAAYYAPLGYGTDTGGSIRGPSTVNGIVGLKPTHGLLSRAGIIPLALSFDTGGPMARSVTDIAVSLGVTVSATADPRDAATQKAVGRIPADLDYTKFLDRGALKGARIGVARDFLGHDAEVDTTIESALSAMRAQGAIVVDVKYPPILMSMRSELYNAIRRPEFKSQIQEYLATLKQPGLPKTHADILALSEKISAVSPEGYVPNPGRLALYRSEAKYPTLDDPTYRAAQTHGMAFVRETLQAIFDKDKLDAIVYPTNPRRPAKIGEEAPSGSSERPSATNFANLAGFPDLIVPAGFTSAGLPVGISFFGPAFSEPKLLALGYSYEQATKNLRVPVHAKPLPGETIIY
jgi:amidase